MRKIYYLLAMFFLINSAAFCQGTNTVLPNIIAKLKTLSTDHVIEKTYLHFDRPYYATGDTMYFKAYVTLGEHHDLSKLSGILHVDLVNPGNVIIRSIKLQLNNGIAWGDFALPDTLQAGSYRVRAFTRYMQNAPEYFFNKTISIASPRGGAVMAAAQQKAKADMQFFPEGGDMISSLVSKVAFKAIGTNGMGLGAKGIIIDNTSAQVATFVSNKLGMGSFYLLPDEGKTYKAKVTFGDGTQSTIDLPAAAAKGIALQVKDTLGNVTVEIRCNKAYFQDNQNKDVNLVIYSGGLVSSVNTKLDNRRMGINIPKAQFSSGIMQITLFSQEGEPLSERLVFLQNPDVLNIAVTSDKASYKTRDRVAINVNTKSKDVAASGFFSVAVVDESKVPFDDNNETTILSYLLLTSNLKGYVEQPNYYFANKTDQLHSELDNLMLTQGYRRFTWKQLMKGDNPPFAFTPEKTLTISGMEKNAAGTPVPNRDVMLMSVTNGSMLGEKTDQTGKFVFDNVPPFYDGTPFMLQATGSTKDKNSTTITYTKEQEPPVTDDNVSDNTVIAGKVYSANGTDVSNVGQNPGTADQTINGDDVSNATSLTTALKAHLNGVNFVSGVPYLKGVKYPMLIVVDGKIRGSYINLDNIPASNVQNIELLKDKNAASYGASGNSGVLVINTRHGSTGIDLNPQNSSYKYQSQSVVKAANASNNHLDEVNYRSSNLGGAGHADQVIRGNDIKNSPTLSSALNGRARGINFLNGVPYLSDGTVVTMGGASPEPMLVMLDGSQASANIDDVNPNVVETIEILKGANASIYGNRGGSGVIVITTRQQLDPVEQSSSSLGSLRFTPQGYYKAREFYSPKYNASNTSGGHPDVRSTIYWNPNVITDTSGNASFEYYNADGKGSYSVIIEGIDTNGNIGRQVYRYKVE
ncbi:MAG: TonB-dependent receptor plug domain-containing protein [Sphingobacteriales bacterium]